MSKSARRSTIGSNPLDQLGPIKGRGRRPSIAVDSATRREIGTILKGAARPSPERRKKAPVAGLTGWMKSVWRSLAG